MNISDIYSFVMPPEWMKDAACAKEDPELFFPDNRSPIQPAKRICARCPVAQPCRELALTNAEEYGVWGGEDEKERRRQKHIAPRTPA